MFHLHASVCSRALAASLALVAAPAMAQVAPAEQGALTQPEQNAPGGPTSAVAPEPDQAGEIIVTAQKRAENVQDVPLAVSVVQPAQLEAAGVRNFVDLGKIAPTLTVRPAQHPMNANVSLRGVGTFAFGIGVESSVAVLVDEVPLAFQARAFTDLPDVERIEVLRGPQSTLYGKSASAGLINIITREPTRDFRARANALATTDDEYGGNFSLSGPINDDFGYVVSASYNNFGGNVYNRTLDRDVGGRETFTTRGKLRWEPVEGAKMTLSLNYVAGNTTPGRVYTELADGATFLGIAGQTADVALPGIEPGDENETTAENYLSRTRYDGGGGNLRTEVDIGQMTLLSITSLDKFTLNDYNDQDATASPTASGANIEVGEFRSHLVTQEVRLLSPGDKPFRYTLGAYYARVRFGRDFQRGPAFSLAQWQATSRSRQLAAYVQADWEVVPSLTLTGGARVQNETIAYTFRDIRNGGFYSGDAEDTAGTYRASARYEFTPDFGVFATYATGYKGQTYDLSTGFNAARAAVGPVKPERSRDREIGIRSQFFDRRVTANLTYFNTSFTNLQAQSIEQVEGSAVQNYRLTNVGGLRTQGVELEGSARVMSDLNFAASVAYLHARYTDYPVAQCFTGQTAAQGCTGTPGRQNLTGKRAVQAPDWKFSVNGDYSPAITDTLRGVGQVSWQYQSDINFGTTDPQTFQPAYHIVNLGAGVRDEERRWELVAFVNNLFDQQYFATLENRNGYFGNARATQGYLPRDFRRYGGLRLALNF